MDPITKKSVTSRDVVFDETSSWHSDIEFTPKMTALADGSDNLKLFSQEIEQTSLNVDPEYQSSDDSSTPRRNTQIIDGGEAPVRQSLRENRQPAYLKDYEVQLNHCSITSCFFAGALDEEEPKCYEETKGCKEWEVAMQDEIEALRKNDTWELVPKPENCKPVTCKWVYRLKKKSDGTIDRYKARLVARGFSQNYGLDYKIT